MKVTNIYKHEIVDTRAFILDPCIQGILVKETGCLFEMKTKLLVNSNRLEEKKSCLQMLKLKTMVILKNSDAIIDNTRSTVKSTFNHDLILLTKRPLI